MIVSKFLPRLFKDEKKISLKFYNFPNFQVEDLALYSTIQGSFSPPFTFHATMASMIVEREGVEK